ncbi:MAG: dienelactone hydrolase family protein [Rhodospirillales bacterium]|nr:dienelactone hydrolase family protein [Rhodospirillales bacterium]
MRVLIVGLFLSWTTGNALAQQRVRFANSSGQTIEAVYLAPPTSADTPVPAVIMLHGCAGLFTKSGKIRSRERAWIDILQQQGWALLLPDSFGSRGHGSLCKVKDRPVTPEKDRPLDALAALAWLAMQPGIDPARIALLGWSNGAMTGLHTVREGGAATPSAGMRDFKTAVLFYPGCIALKKSHPEYRPRIPVLIQHGELDDWTLAAPCRQLVETVNEDPAAPEMSIDIYPGSYHNFDHPNSKLKTITTRHSGYKTGERQVHTGTNPDAREKAIRRTLEWLLRQFS